MTEGCTEGNAAVKIGPGIPRAVYSIARLRQQRTDVAEVIHERFRVSALTARILAARGFNADSALKDFIQPTLRTGMPSPGGLRNLDAACSLIKEAVADGGSIGICCDFDVDGLSSGAQLFHLFSTIGVQSRVFVPDRFADGYGLNEQMVRDIANSGFSLLVALDYGTTNIREIELARQLGLRTIVIDHHHVGADRAMPDVFVNPLQSDCGFADGTLCTAGLVWYLIVALCKCLPQAKGINPKSYLDLACLGTICDMVPLVGANRVLAKRGMEMLARTARPGLISLKNVARLNREIDCGSISFGIGPRLNAAGRMVHGDLVIELLTTKDSKRAQHIARKLDRLNSERQDIESRVKQAALSKIQELDTLPPGLVVWDDSFHTGVIGIVAQRLVETFHRPAVVFGADKEGEYKGSVRGIRNFNVIAALTASSNFSLKYGGHEMAGGLSVRKEDVDGFAAAFIGACKQQLEGIDSRPHAEADTEATLKELTPEVINELKLFSPCGVGNPTPTVLIRKLKVLDVVSLKGEHLKAMLTDGHCYIPGLLWRCKEHPALEKGRIVDIVCRPGMSSFNGYQEIQATLQAVEVV